MSTISVNDSESVTKAALVKCIIVSGSIVEMMSDKLKVTSNFRVGSVSVMTSVSVVVLGSNVLNILMDPLEGTKVRANEKLLGGLGEISFPGSISAVAD